MKYKTTMEEPAGSAARVAEELRRLGISADIKEMPDSTRSASEAAAAIGCAASEIVKSLVFRAVDSDDPVLVLAPGSARVDESKLAAEVGEPVEQANGRFVRERTGFAIGGVAPVGHSRPVATYMDRSLLDHDLVWAAAGTPRSVFPIDPKDLQRASQAKVADLAVDA